MSAVLYREFRLTVPSVWSAIVALVKANAKACIESGKPLLVIVTVDEKKRNTQQNRRLWGCVYEQIADQAWVNGRQYSKDVWHEYFARKWGVCEDITLPSGEVITRRKSTSDMTIAEFAEYMQKVEADAACNLGVTFQ